MSLFIGGWDNLEFREIRNITFLSNVFKISLTGNEIKVKAKSSAKILKVIVYQEK